MSDDDKPKEHTCYDSTGKALKGSRAWCLVKVNSGQASWDKPKASKKAPAEAAKETATAEPQRETATAPKGNGNGKDAAKKKAAAKKAKPTK